MVKKPLRAALYTLAGSLRPPPKPFFGKPRPLPKLPLGRRGGELPGDWQADPLTGYRWPKVHGLFVEYRGAKGDLRSAWEAHRFRWVKPSEFLGVFSAWARANRPPLGVAWSSGLEVAVRAVNLAFLAEGAGLDVARKALVRGWLLAHLRFLEAHPDRGLPNHGLGWALGVLLLKGYLGFNLEKAWEEFRREVQRNFLPDGFHAERATGYHLFATEALLIGLALGRAWGLRLGELPQIGSKALEVVAHLERPDGSFPLVGDFDDGGFLRPRTEPYIGFLRELAEAAGLDFPKFREKLKFFEQGGYLTMRGEGWHLATRVRDEASLPGGHLHEDMDSFDLWPTSPDPGVFRYGGEGSRREELRRARAHNGFWRGEAYKFPSPFRVEGRQDALSWGWEGSRFFAEHGLFGARLGVWFEPAQRGVRITYRLEGDGWEGGLNVLGGEVSVEGARVSEGKGIWCPRYGEAKPVRRLLLKPEGDAVRIEIKV